MSHAAKHQKITTVALTSDREASIIGVDGMSAMPAPATTEMASAPIATQYGGSNCSGVTPWWTKRSVTSTAMPA